MSTDAEKQRLGRLLRKLMLDKGWNQSELARRARMGRDNISCYIRGKTYPNPPQMARIAKALGIQMEELAPQMSALVRESPLECPIEMIELDGDTAFLRMAKVLPLADAMEIVAIVRRKQSLTL